jgi:antitoxin component of MazEF toxin-antitoxin module
LAFRLPKKLVQALDLKVGDRLELVAADGSTLRLAKGGR